MASYDPEEFFQALLTPISPVEENLFIGNRQGAQDKELLKSHRVQHIIQIQNVEVPPFYPSDFNYLCIHMPDVPDSNIASTFSIALPFIAKGLQANETVYVHCDGGVSRSGSIIIAYLMASRGLCYDDAYMSARKVRACIRPNEGFERQIRDLESEVLRNYLQVSSGF